MRVFVLLCCLLLLFDGAFEADEPSHGAPVVNQVLAMQWIEPAFLPEKSTDARVATWNGRWQHFSDRISSPGLGG